MPVITGAGYNRHYAVPVHNSSSSAVHPLGNDCFELRVSARLLQSQIDTCVHKVVESLAVKSGALGGLH